MFFAHQALRQHLQFLAESGRGKALAPDLALQQVDQLGAAVLGFERAVSLGAPCQGGNVQPFLRHLVQALLKGVKVFFQHGAASRHGMAAKAQ